MKTRVAAVILFIAVLLTSGCSERPKTDDLFAMDTVMSFSVYGTEESIRSAKAEINRLDALLSVTREDSQVAKLNAEHKTECGGDLAAIITRSLEVSKMTRGAFDITIRPVSKLWGFTGDSPALPDKADIERVLDSVGYQQISIDENGEAVCPGEIDLGGIAKGYAAGKVRGILEDAGVTSAAVSLGGNVMLIGSKPDGSDWNVGIRDPSGDGVFGILAASDTAVVTSGGYERNFIQDGVTYHHIIDPSTGYPADSGIISATVVTKDDALADALSTAVYVMGVDEAAQLWREREGFELIMVTDSGEVLVTEGIYGRFKLKEDSYRLTLISRLNYAYFDR